MKTILITFIAIFTVSVNTQAQATSLDTSTNKHCTYSSKVDIHNVVGLYDWLANSEKKNEWYVGENADLNTSGNCNIHTAYNFNFSPHSTTTNSQLEHSLEERLALTPKYDFKQVSNYNTNLGLDFRINL